MFELSILLLALFIVAFLSFIQIIYIPLPPKAKLLCDIWDWANKKTGRKNGK